LQYAYLNSFYQSGLKNLLDVAVLNEVDIRKDLHIDDQAYAKIDEIPFDFVRRRMSVVVGKKETSEHILICKGAVEEVLNSCIKGELDGKPFDMSLAHRAETLKLAQDLNEDGFRVIAVAHKDMPPEQAVYGVKDECDLTLIGFIAFLDPPKESAAPAIAALEGHGITVKILTGDNDIVARRICKDVNLNVEGVLLGADLANMTDDELAQKVDHTTLFAKLSPAQKARVIAALHQQGHVVGFLGDGINDGPALKAADVGVSVDTAADIAKESADIILLEKSLMVLEEGVLEGRKVFGNITKYIKMGASSNFGNMFSVLGASAWLPFLPMLPIQILANNLLYDFSQTTIPTDNVDEEYLTQPRRWDIGHIAKFMVFLGPISSIFDYLTFAVMYFGFGANTDATAPMFQTAWFVESILTQTLIIHIIRTNKIPFIQSRASWPLIFTTVVICTIGISLPTSYMAHSLGFVALPWTFWPVVATIIASYLMLAHVVKSWFIRRFGWN
jgi:Mg2+-importing ATPase